MGHLAVSHLLIQSILRVELAVEHIDIDVFPGCLWGNQGIDLAFGCCIRQRLIQ